MPEAAEEEHLWHTGIQLDTGPMVKSCLIQEVKLGLNSLSDLKSIATATTKDKIQ